MNTLFDEQLKNYAELAVLTGCNLQPGQELFVSADVSQVQLVRHVVRCAYEHGAKNVTVQFGDEQIGRMQYDFKPAEAFKEFPSGAPFCKMAWPSAVRRCCSFPARTRRPWPASIRPS